jgi:hypothetical protein
VDGESEAVGVLPEGALEGAAPKGMPEGEPVVVGIYMGIQKNSREESVLKL